MTLSDFWARVSEIYAANQDDYDYIGIRFEDKGRSIGDICECSKHNIDREDERDFPIFGTDEYNQMFTFDGTSAWDLSQSSTYKYAKYDADKDICKCFLADHCYIIVGNYITNCDDGLDDGEIVIEDAQVVAIMF